jgi:uncharacterized protein (TIGR02147 family)
MDSGTMEMTDKGEASYRRILKDAFLERKEKNRTYSLRAFARHLGLSPAFVSYVFQEKRHLSPKIAMEIARKLNWNVQKQRYFLSLIEFENPKTDISQESAIEQIRKYQSSELKVESLEADIFAAISTWYYNAILSLLNLKNSKHTTQSIAQRLKLEKFEAESALHRLEKLGLVRQNGNEWSSIHCHIQVKSIPSRAIRSYHKQSLKRAEEALDQQPFEERDFSTMTLTVDPSQFELAKKKALEFRTEMVKLFENSNPTEVYQLSVQFFRLTQPCR